MKIDDKESYKNFTSQARSPYVGMGNVHREMEIEKLCYETMTYV